MYIDKATVRSSSGRVHVRYLLRVSYRENGRVKKKTLANLSDCSPRELEALRLALQHKDNLAALTSLDQLTVRQGPAFGAVWLLTRLAGRLGLSAALGSSRPARLALWLVVARVLDQGSRLSAVRLAERTAAAEILGLEPFDEDDLYRTLDWLAGEQTRIEDALVAARPDGPPTLYLYDVTSSYLEGVANELGAFGYNRDRKRGKRQIVIGLLTDPAGTPVSVQVYAGNQADPTTFTAQVEKVRGRWSQAEVVWVGDRGMIRGPQIEHLGAAGCRYITALTKPQIEVLVDRGLLQLGLFDEALAEVSTPAGTRYLMRRNPQRAAEVAAHREQRCQALQRRVEERNRYLAAHRRASAEVALGRLVEWRRKLKLGEWVRLEVEGRRIVLSLDETGRALESRLDGCYVLKTDVPAGQAAADVIHARYQDLKEVEWAFRTLKTGHLEVRPLWLRKAERTRAHVLVVMLAYLLVQELRRCWKDLDLTVAEGLQELGALGLTELRLGRESKGFKVSQPQGKAVRLLEACQVSWPKTVPWKQRVRVATRKPLGNRRT